MKKKLNFLEKYALGMVYYSINSAQLDKYNHFIFENASPLSHLLVLSGLLSLKIKNII